MKVKEAILRHHGPGGIVNALLAFDALHAKAVESGAIGMNYEDFMSYLRSQGVDLRASEANYLCASFDDDGKGFISPKTFVRHLLGMNLRRMSVVEQSWAALPKNEDGEVPIADLIDIHETNNGVSSGFRQGIRAAFGGQKSRENRQMVGRNPDAIMYEEFVAYAAAMSLHVKLDEDFQKQILREWKSDEPTAPMMHETERDWGEEGDPLVIDGPRYVKDALNFELGRSSKQYNYSHNQRYWRQGIILPQLDRPSIMVSTVQRTYVPYSQEQKDSADPLVTRRGQMY